MSRQLPARPNLEHLKNQAKDLLDDLVKREPQAKLADALHALAREYGFPSWPKLKAHVTSLSASTGGAHPFVGRWIADFSRSRRHPLDESRSATLHLTVAGDVITIVDVVVDDAGKDRRGENVLVADGNDYRSELGTGYSVCTRRSGSRAVVVVMTKDGRDAGRVTYSVSDDARTLTVAAAAEAHDGYPASDQLIVFDRAN